MELNLSGLPNLPQIVSLKQIAANLWRHNDVWAVWTGGSFAQQGKADLYSDVDLRIAVPAVACDKWRRPDLAHLASGMCVAHTYQSFGQDSFLHQMILATGEVYDLWVQSVEQISVEETCLVLGCRDARLAERLARGTSGFQIEGTVADPIMIRQLLVDFWMSTHKHSKVLYRGLDVLVLTGLQAERATLLRLWAVLASGLDTGNERPSIHSLTHQARVVMAWKSSAALEVLGSSVRTRRELLNVIERFRDEVSATGRKLADRMGFDYPSELERTVREGWQRFLL